MATKQQLLNENEELKKQIEKLKEENGRLNQLLRSEGIFPTWLEEGNHVSEEQYERIYNHWLSLDLYNHRKLSQSIKRSIDNALSRYNEEEILDAIDNYAEVVKDKTYYFNTIWSLDKFLKQPNALLDFMNNGTKWLNYLEKKKRRYF